MIIIVSNLPIHKDCIISNIIWDSSPDCKLSFDVTDRDGKIYNILISNHNIKERLLRLKNKEIVIEYCDYGLNTNIDIEQYNDGTYSITVSPCDGIYDYYDLAENEINKLLV